MKSNLEKLKKIKTSAQFMFLHSILEDFERRITELEKRPTLEEIKKNFKRQSPFGMEIRQKEER